MMVLEKAVGLPNLWSLAKTNEARKVISTYNHYYGVLCEQERRQEWVRLANDRDENCQAFQGIYSLPTSHTYINSYIRIYIYIFIKWCGMGGMSCWGRTNRDLAFLLNFHRVDSLSTRPGCKTTQPPLTPTAAQIHMVFAIVRDCVFLRLYRVG